jgi:formiminotetrahydrofolate cyclodeaminase
MTGGAEQPSASVGDPEGLPDYTQMTVGQFIEAIGAPEPAPAGGSVAAVTATLAASLAAMTARLSTEQWELAGAVGAQAVALRDRLAPLAQEDAVAYMTALERMRSARHAADSTSTSDQKRRSEDRDRELAAALRDAAAVPLRIAEAAADVAQLAADTAQLGNPAVSADAAAAVALACGAARAAAHIVVVNLGVTEGDEMLERAKRAAEAADAASARAFAALQ